MSSVTSCPPYSRQSSLYARCLGPAWETLHQSVRRAHVVNRNLRQAGHFRIVRGKSWVCRMLATVLRLPHEAENVAVVLTISETDSGERWDRCFGDQQMTTTQWFSGGHLHERLGPLVLQFQLAVVGGALEYHQLGAALVWGRLSLGLPRRMQPVVSAREEADGNGRNHVSVTVNIPVLGLLIAYEGRIAPESTQ